METSDLVERQVRSVIFLMIVKFNTSNYYLSNYSNNNYLSDGEFSIDRIQRKRYRDMQSKIIRLWDRFDNDEIDSYRLLKKCSILAVPSV